MDIKNIVDQAKQIDIADLISRYTPLEKVSGHEYQGPCPKCGGSDRLHCTAEWWFCRQCHTKRGDAIDFMQFVAGGTFQEATERLTNQVWPERKKPVITRNNPARPDDRDESWFLQAAALLKNYQLKLPGSEGATYLRGRSLTPATWAAFRLGYTPNYSGYPCIAIPWYRGGKVTAIHYRYLNPPGKQKIISLKGSKTTGALFGSQALPDWVSASQDVNYRGMEQHCTLVICEGEINAMSIWQVAHGTNLHVMSMGSESGKLSAGAIEFAKRYGQVIIWMDKDERVTDVMDQVPGAYGFASPSGNDANDMLKAGKLGGELTVLRWKAARSDDELSRLMWDLWDAANEDDGLDTSTAMAFKKLCEYLGREFVFVEGEPDRWFTGRRVATLKTG